MPAFIFPILIFLPNLLFILFPPQQTPAAKPHKGPIYNLMTALERIGQISVIVIPFFYGVSFRNINLIALGVAIATLAFYYTGWLRYMLQGRKHSLLFTPMLGIPMPMVVSPIAYFYTVSFILASWPMLAGTVVLAVGHLYISYMEIQG